MSNKLVPLLLLIAIITPIVQPHTTQRPGPNDDDDDSDSSNPFLDMATSFLTETLANQNGGGSGGGASGIGGIASLIGTLMQPDGKSGGGGGGGGGAMQIISGIASMMAANGGGGGGGGGFDPSMIGNIIQMFTSATNDNGNRNRRAADGNEQEGFGLENLLNLAATFMGGNNNKVVGTPHEQGRFSPEGLASLLPMVMQAVNSFSGEEGHKTEQRHKDHAWVLPPFLEKIHVMWDHFSNSELAQALWQKSGANQVFKGFVGRDGKLDYDRLFESLQNQSFRRRWIKSATLYMADWANYLADPEVYQRYFQTGEMMLNGFLKSQGYPKQALFDPSRASETLSSLVDHALKQHLSIKVTSKTYVKPAVNYVKELLKLGKARGLLQKFNATELSDKLTDTVNLEVIEPVLKVHRGYRYAAVNTHCDKFVLCELNSHDPNEQSALTLSRGFKSGIAKFGSMAAAWFLSNESGTPFWTLFGVINEPYDCQRRFPVDCSGFHEGEARVTTEYFHNEL